MSNAFLLRKKWIDFFVEKNHADVSNRPIIPNSSDKSLLFINSGVAAIKDYFCGDVFPPAKRLVSCQKVIRTGDIDAIGDSFRHHTYFEMLGNFSLGDYFKKEAINWAWEFLTKILELNRNSLFVTVYEDDQESFEEWKKLIPESRIIKSGKSTNFWDMGVGPCGPCTEIYFDKGEKYDPEGKGILLLKENIENERFLEIWNIVFSEYLNVDGKIVKSNHKNIDTGAGLERILSILEGKDSNFETSLFSSIIEYLEERLNIKGQVLWAIADYFRTSCLLLNEGIFFGGKGREYVLRRIFRKSLFLIGDNDLSHDFFIGIVDVISSSLQYYVWDTKFIVKSMFEEYLLYEKTREFAIYTLESLISRYSDEIPAKEVFDLVSSRGLSYQTIENFLRDNNRTFNKEEYLTLSKKHKEVSFNSNISSAFTKTIPSLIEFKDLSVMDYVNSTKESKIIALFNENFERVMNIVSGYVVLDSTVIFPVSGGQDSDIGKIDDCEVLNSFKAPNGQILHKVVGNYEVGQTVVVSHDTNKRKYLEIHHTLEHLLFELLRRDINPLIERYSGNKYADHFNLEVRVPKEINRESFDLLSLNKKLQELIERDLKVDFSFITLEESKNLGLPQNFEEVYKKSSDSLRFVNIGGYSRELCFGTHVNKTSQIANCLIVDFKKKQSNIYRFKVVGGDLVKDYLCGKSVEEFFNPKDNKEEESKILKKQIFLNEKKNFCNEVLNNKEKLMVINRNMEVELALETFKELGRKISKKTVFLFFEQESNIFRFFIVSDLMDVGSLLRNLRNKYGWKCGGNSGFGSGVGEGEDFLNKFMSNLEL